VLRAELERRFVTVEEIVTVAARELTVIRPRSAEDLISEADFEHDERLPYWADIWPSSLILAEWMLEHERGGAAVELGCGIGLVTAAAMLAGLRVLATDYYADALAFTRLNTLLNTGREPAVRHLDWRALPPDLKPVPFVFASDVLYERPYSAAVANTLAQLLRDGGEAIIADPGRVAAPDFLRECEARGLQLESSEPRPFTSGEIRQTITLYSLSASASSSRAFTSTPQR
jgi:ETFB lysine methyltransferase